VALKKSFKKMDLKKKKNENISKEYSLSIKTFLCILAKFCTKRHVDWHTQVNPSCYLVLNFKVFPPHILHAIGT
jgi:hypothetical protein